jgi:hypothetical protein
MQHDAAQRTYSQLGAVNFFTGSREGSLAPQPAT